MPTHEPRSGDNGTPGHRSADELELEVKWNAEYANALASAAQHCYGYADRMRIARMQDGLDPVEPGQPTRVEQCRAEHRGFLRRLIGVQTLEFAVLDDIDPGPVDTKT